MDRIQLQKLRELPIEGVAERLGLQVVRHKCLCPFHDDHHASMSFSVRRNTYRCFVCGAHGGVIDLAMALLPNSGGREGSPFLDACRWLADEHNVILEEGVRRQEEGVRRQESGDRRNVTFDASRYERFFERPWLNDEARRFLFEERRLDPRVVRWCRLTSWRDKQGIPWLQTPYYDREGRLVGIQNRNLSFKKMDSECDSSLFTFHSSLPSAPRFRFPSGSECTIYNLPVLNLLKPGDDLYITEGCSDCWAMLSAGHKAIAIPSATLLKRKDIANLHKGTDPLCKFHMFPDRDEPGERLFLQLKEVLPNLVRHQLPPDCKDFSDYYLSAGLSP